MSIHVLRFSHHPMTLYDHIPNCMTILPTYGLLPCSTSCYLTVHHGFRLTWKEAMHYEVYKLASQLPLQKKKPKKQRHEIHVRSKHISSQRVKLKHFRKKPKIEIEQLN